MDMARPSNLIGDGGAAVREMIDRGKIKSSWLFWFLLGIKFFISVGKIYGVLIIWSLQLAALTSAMLSAIFIIFRKHPLSPAHD